METASLQDETRRIAEAFVEARQARQALSNYPGRVPTTLASAYAVQEAALAVDARAVGGWKVGRINPAREGIDRLAGPIFAETIVAAQPGLEMPVFAGGFGAAEAEFLLRLGAAPPAGKTRFTEDEAADLVGAVHVGIEIASSPFAGINELGAAVTISDYGNNNGLVVGPEIPHWRSADIRSWPVTLEVNGVQIGAAKAETMLDGPVGAVRFLLELMAVRGIALEAGQWISTGAVTGVHVVRPGDSVAAGFGDGYELGCAIVAA